ncbi:hypothetical protein FJZ53_00115 [Candidatus Woesearchaeota archaeon]|nr:hypothetical protein [Candidatus Woesearchaeota archaeon]
MNKKLIIIISLVAILILGCPGIKLKLPGKSTTASGKQDFIGGPKGVDAEVVYPLQGGKAYLAQPFRISVKAVNNGESDSDGKVCAFGSFSQCECQPFTLKSRTRVDKEKLEGEQATVTFETGKISQENLVGSSHFVTARTRYKYNTYGIATACVKKDSYSKEGCQLTPAKNILKSVSSAPLAIQEVNEAITPSEGGESVDLSFTIKIKNIGTGDVYNVANTLDCKTEDSSGGDKKIGIRMLNAPGRATCTPVELKKEGDATTHCTINGVKLSTDDYETEITIELEYAYETVDSNTFEVG